MKDKTYRYSGPNSAVTLSVPDAKGNPVSRDVMLWQGRDVVLPDGHAYTVILLAQRLIEPVEPPAAQAAPQAPSGKPAVASADSH